MIKTTNYVALLRGINVGGNAPISMARLKECFEQLGFLNVKTYINSGNVVFSTTSDSPRKLEPIIEKAIEKEFSLNVRVLVRSYMQIEELIKQIPKSWNDSENYKYNVIFLAKGIDNPAILDDVHPKPGIEELHYHPGVLFWSAKKSDLTKGNMIKLSKSALYKQMTVRNLNTAKKIYALLQQVELNTLR
jgi:uncharacterized protein (DUF1697 family)